MKKTYLSRFALLLAVMSVAAFGTLSVSDAYAAAQSNAHHAKTHHAKKTTAKKSKKSAKTAKKPKSGFELKAPPASKAAHARAIMGTPDPNVDEPSEMITAIKNRAQDKFWDGKRPYPEQLREQMSPPPPAPIFTGAIAQKELQKRDGTNPTGLRNDTLRRASYSDISGVTFDDQPLRMNASEAFRRSLDTVSFELGRPCKTQEYFGWPMQQSEQARVDRIFEETNAKFKLRGYNLQPKKPRSVGSDVAAFTADRSNKRILGIWSAGDVGLLLLMCDSDVPAATAAKAKPDAALSKKKLRKAKKKSRSAVTSTSITPSSTGATQPDAPTAGGDPNGGASPAGAPTEAKPQVIPGAPPKTLPPEPVQSVPTQPTAPAVPAPLPAPTPVPTPAAPAPEPKAETPPANSGVINPSNAFIPADAPTAMKAGTPDIKPPSVDGAVDAAKDAVKDAVKP
ncbi:MAG: hypothetical protein SFW65_02330 [Alphaproteobacteria bacterium]|nr:hypothetical protein [Alphaproteobacteria bacterium]